MMMERTMKGSYEWDWTGKGKCGIYSRQTWRRMIAERDGRYCMRCGTGPMRKRGSLDHIIPLSIGGTWDENNLQWLCKKCNTTKGATVAIWSPHIKIESLIRYGWEMLKVKIPTPEIDPPVFVLTVYVCPIPRGAEVLLIKEWKEGRVPMVLVKRRHGEGEAIVPREWIREPYII